MKMAEAAAYNRVIHAVAPALRRAPWTYGGARETDVQLFVLLDFVAEYVPDGRYV